MLPPARSRKEHHLMTSIAILGAGRVGANLAGKLTTAGHRVILGRRSTQAPAAALGEAAGSRFSLSDQRTAVRAADIVINATPGDSTLDRLTGLRTELAGKLLIDVSNATHDVGGLPGGLCYPGSSLAEQLQAALPDTRVVKTLNTMLFTVMTAPETLATPPTVYVSGNDEDAKETVTGLLGDLGWQRAWIEDLGDITTARATEAMILIVPHILNRHGFTPFAVSLAR
ncbi:NADPH-dependent F420 reductase [Streptomyces sp. NPDC058611]|uniref:NADPH-dependent F420 reductase n=1 Tax=unclassified Streptomyces TaxID=2593676 RepID=UPI00365AD584